jgi:hypothetical protein
MTEKHIIGFNKTFLKYDQFEIKIFKTAFIANENPENVFYCYNGLAYKIRVIGVRFVQGSTSEIKGIVFYSDFNLLFKKNNPNLKEKDKIEILITDEPLDNLGFIIAS